MDNNHKTLEETQVTLAVHDEKINQVERAVTKIAENDLPHIYRKIDSINNKLAYGGGAVSLAILGFQLWSNLK